jgi:hypothetical protein
MPSSVNNVWASATPAGKTEEITLESGQTCLAVKMTIEGMIESGMVAEADALTAQVNKHTRKIKGAKGKADGVQLDDLALMKDPQGMRALITMMDKAIPQIVVSPVVRLHYTETTVGKTTVTKKLTDEEREAILAETPGIVFTDQIDFADKVELFNWAAGGLAAMLQFRQ